MRRSRARLGACGLLHAANAAAAPVAAAAPPTVCRNPRRVIRRGAEPVPPAGVDGCSGDDDPLSADDDRPSVESSPRAIFRPASPMTTLPACWLSRDARVGGLMPRWRAVLRCT